jgi:hypothetical protein
LSGVATVAVLNVHVADGAALGQAVAQVLPVLSLYSYWTDATPLPLPSPLVESRVIVPFSAAPGSLIVTVGAVLSTRRLKTGDEIVWLPAASVATVRRS